MTRPFSPDDDGKRVECNGRPGWLEFPLEDPGSANPGEAIFWYDRFDKATGKGWDYVQPSDVEPLKGRV